MPPFNTIWANVILVANAGRWTTFALSDAAWAGAVSIAGVVSAAIVKLAMALKDHAELVRLRVEVQKLRDENNSLRIDKSLLVMGSDKGLVKAFHDKMRQAVEADIDGRQVTRVGDTPNPKETP